MAKVAVSILNADWGHLQDEVDKVRNADFLHLDIADGHFVDNISFGPHVVSCLKTKLKKVVHLMVEEPEKYVDRFIEAGAEEIIFPLESCQDLDGMIEKLSKKKVKIGISINPETKIHWLRFYFDKIDRILIMTIHPGFSGQEFIYTMLDKITEIREESGISIAVDGGINEKTAKMCILAGADVVVSDTFIFRSNDPKAAVEILKKI